MISVAATQFSLEKVSDPKVFWDRITYLIESVKKQKASVVVLPEYFSLSLMLNELKTSENSFKDCLKQSLPHSQAVLEKAQALAKKYQMALVLGTLPWVTDKGIVNRSHFIYEDGTTLKQDKIFMTRFEDEVWKITAGEKKLKVFDWNNIKCAILTCYDSEFPILSKTLAESGVELLFVPSCTDTEHGYWRVRHCCQARTVENQLFVVMSSIVSGDKNHEEIDGHYGWAGIFSPCDTLFPPNGVLNTCAKPNVEDVCVSQINLQDLATTRKSGSVLNLRDSHLVKEIPFGE